MHFLERKISLKLFASCPILVQLMDWCRTSDKPLPELMLTKIYAVVIWRPRSSVVLHTSPRTCCCGDIVSFDGKVVAMATLLPVRKLKVLEETTFSRYLRGFHEHLLAVKIPALFFFLKRVYSS